VRRGRVRLVSRVSVNARSNTESERGDDEAAGNANDGDPGEPAGPGRDLVRRIFRMEHPGSVCTPRADARRTGLVPARRTVACGRGRRSSVRSSRWPSREAQRERGGSRSGANLERPSMGARNFVSDVEPQSQVPGARAPAPSPPPRPDPRPAGKSRTRRRRHLRRATTRAARPARVQRPLALTRRAGFARGHLRPRCDTSAHA
jgi:hypothetical protein